MTDGAEKNGLKIAQLPDRAVRENISGFQVSVSAEIEVGQLDLKAEFIRRGLQGFEAFTHHFRAGAVSRDYRDIVSLAHGYSCSFTTLIFPRRL